MLREQDLLSVALVRGGHASPDERDRAWADVIRAAERAAEVRSEPVVLVTPDAVRRLPETGEGREDRLAENFRR